MAADAETDREDGVQMVVLDLPRHLPFAFDSNYSEFPNSCPKLQFPLGKNAFQVLVHVIPSRVLELLDRELFELVFGDHFESNVNLRGLTPSIDPIEEGGKEGLVRSAAKP